MIQGGGGKIACATYFGHISVTSSWIRVVLNSNVIMRPHEEKRYLQIVKIGRVIAIFVRLTEILKPNRHQKKLFYSNFQPRPKYYESLKTEYSDSTSFINRLTPHIFLWF